MIMSCKKLTCFALLVVALSGCQQANVKSSVAPEKANTSNNKKNEIKTNVNKKDSLVMFVFGESDTENQTKRQGFYVEFSLEPSALIASDQPTLIYQD